MKEKKYYNEMRKLVKERQKLEVERCGVNRRIRQNRKDIYNLNKPLLIE